MQDCYVEKAACLALLAYYAPPSMKIVNRSNNLSVWIETYRMCTDHLIGALIALDLLSYNSGIIRLTARGFSCVKELYWQVSNALGEDDSLDDFACGIISAVLYAVDKELRIDRTTYSSV